MKENPLNKQLNPCPFCGGKAEIRMTEYGGSYVICTDCFCRTTVGSMGIVVCLWNRRRKDAFDDLPKVVEKTRKTKVNIKQFCKENKLKQINF